MTCKKIDRHPGPTHFTKCEALTEIDEQHAMSALLRDMERAKLAAITRIELAPLDANTTARFVGIALGEAVEFVTPLAEVVFEKTAGNPFFVQQFLTALHEQGVVTFDAPTDRWSWDLDRVRDACAMDNVVELVIARLRKLSEESRNALAIASWVGNTWDLDTLALVQKLEPHECIPCTRGRSSARSFLTACSRA